MTAGSTPPRISARKLQRYLARLRGIEDGTEKLVYRAAMSVDYKDFEEAAAALSDAVAAVYEAMSGATAEAQAAWIEQTLILAGDAEGAQLMQAAALEALATSNSGVVPHSLKMAIRANMQKLGSGVNEAKSQAAQSIARATAAEAKRQGFQIVEESITRANATAEQLGRSPLGLMVMWVPGVANPCGFCTMLASNSWRMANKLTIGLYRDHIHDGCRCEQVFKPADVTVAGVSPKSYAAQVKAVREPLRNAAGEVVPQYIGGRANPAYWDEVARAIDRRNYARDAEEIRAQHREDYRLRKEVEESEQ